MFEILKTDKYFYDSPEAGHPKCLCSRCNKKIPSRDAPIIRAFPSREAEFGYDPLRSTEYRFCRDCSDKMGLRYAESSDEDDDLPNVVKYWGSAEEKEISDELIKQKMDEFVERVKKNTRNHGTDQAEIDCELCGTPVRGFSAFMYPDASFKSVCNSCAKKEYIRLNCDNKN